MRNLKTCPDESGQVYCIILGCIWRFMHLRLPCPHPPLDNLGAPSPAPAGGAREIRYSPQRMLEAFVVVHGQLGFDFLDNFNDYRNHNEQTGTAKSKSLSAGKVLQN